VPINKHELSDAVSQMQLIFV